MFTVFQGSNQILDHIKTPKAKFEGDHCSEKLKFVTQVPLDETLMTEFIYTKKMSSDPKYDIIGCTDLSVKHLSVKIFVGKQFRRYKPITWVGGDLAVPVSQAGPGNGHCQVTEPVSVPLMLC